MTAKAMLVGVALSWFYVGAAHGASEDEHDVGTASRIGPTRLENTVTCQFPDWAWIGQRVIVSEKVDGEWVINLLRISGARLEPDSVKRRLTGRMPVVVDDERFACIRDDRFIVLAATRDAGMIDSIEIGAIGVVGELTYAANTLWLHAVKTDVQPVDAQMYAVRLDPMRLVRLGRGYYPTSSDGSTIYFSNHVSDYSLSVLKLSGEHEITEPRILLGTDVFAPQAAREADVLVCQRGVHWPKIELLTTDGKLTRCLSGDGRSGVWPRLSPSGRYVAFTHHENNDDRAKVVEVVDLQGRLVHQVLIGSHSITSAYRWAPFEDRLAVVVPQPMGRRTLELISVQELDSNRMTTDGL